MAEKSLILICGRMLGRLRIALAPHLFVHCVCLKSLASYLYTDLDDSFNECPDAASRLAAFSEKKADSLDLQAFCVSFVTFFRENYNERKRPFFHLCAQFIHFLSSLFPPTAFPPTLPFHSPTATCTYCHGASHLLVKCQHKDCSVFAHFPCYLAHNHACFHVLLNAASVSLLFYCDAHHDEGLRIIQEDAAAQNQGISAGTRLGNRTKEAISRCRAFLSELTAHAHFAEFPRDSFFFAHMQNYREWLGVEPWQERRLHWSSRKFQLEGNPHDGRFLMEVGGKQEVCGVCKNGLTKEIFPRLLSPVVECTKCGAKAHGFCVRDGKRSGWVCPRCSRENAVCAFCHKSEGFLSCVDDVFCHVGCMLCALCVLCGGDNGGGGGDNGGVAVNGGGGDNGGVAVNGGGGDNGGGGGVNGVDDTTAADNTTVVDNIAEECTHCHKGDCVFRCCVKGCSYRSHVLCGEEKHDCLFALAQCPPTQAAQGGAPSPARVSVYYVCSMHASSMDINAIAETATPITLSLGPEQRFLWSLLHPLRCCLSLTAVHVYNNSPAEQCLRAVFTQAGYVDLPVKKQRPPRPDKDKDKDKPAKETHSRARRLSQSRRSETAAPDKAVDTDNASPTSEKDNTAITTNKQ